MNFTVRWATSALADREGIFRYLNREAGFQIAQQTDDKFISMSRLLAENPLMGVATVAGEHRRRLTVVHFPFIMVYAIEAQQIAVLRVLHTSRRVADFYR
ncbi:type II toxin-antitoxin system RelE/ParE family toxin [Erwinia sp. B116]|uniref:type II toxin-antitoxin system RelE/ParE family toxin n=1 Tax=Erwinia sp. B116 TaxID=1561024 RepID=UPI000C761FBB|nr:type II toxin-antitoxin system RelE/ParE family toxin [Erwinia sp. B116]PLV62255.1 plasmid stabilization protein [Erwinia sp. B116]